MRAGVIGTEFVKLGTKFATHTHTHTHTHTSAGGAEAARAGVPDDALIQGMLDVLILYLIYYECLNFIPNLLRTPYFCT